MKRTKYFLLILLFTVSCNEQKRSAFTNNDAVSHNENSGPSDESIFVLTDTFTDQDNRHIQLEDFAGKPTLISMIFTKCNYACPRLTADVKAIEDELGKKAEGVNFVLVRFDTERDTPEQLKKFQKEMKLDDRFTLLHGDEDAVRTLSVLLDIQYQQNANGDFSHSNLITALDRDGKIVWQKEGINSNHTQTIATLKELAGR